MHVDEALTRACDSNSWTHHGDMVELEIGGAGKRRQRVWHEPATDPSLRRIFSFIGEGAALNDNQLRAALALNFELGLAALALRGESLVVVHGVLVENTTEEEVAAVIRRVGTTADEYERALFDTDQH